MRVWSLGREDPLEEESAIPFSLLARIIPWREDPDGLQSRGSPKVRHDLVTKQKKQRCSQKWKKKFWCKHHEEINSSYLHSLGKCSPAYDRCLMPQKAWLDPDSQSLREGFPTKLQGTCVKHRWLDYSSPHAAASFLNMQISPVNGTASPSGQEAVSEGASPAGLRAWDSSGSL